MQRIMVALAALACLALLIPAPAAGHATEKCSPGILKQAEQHVAAETAQLSKAVDQYLAALAAGHPSAATHLDRVAKEAADLGEALTDLAFHQGLCA